MNKDRGKQAREPKSPADLDRKILAAAARRAEQLRGQPSPRSGRWLWPGAAGLALSLCVAVLLGPGLLQQAQQGPAQPRAASESRAEPEAAKTLEQEGSAWIEFELEAAVDELGASDRLSAQANSVEAGPGPRSMAERGRQPKPGPAAKRAAYQSSAEPLVHSVVAGEAAASIPESARRQLRLIAELPPAQRAQAYRKLRRQYPQLPLDLDRALARAGEAQ